MDEGRLTKQIYGSSMGGPAGRGRQRRTYLDQIGDVLKKGQVKSTYNRRACMKGLMKVEEAKEVCQDRSMWKDVVCLPQREKGVTVCMYFISKFSFIIDLYVCCLVQTTIKSQLPLSTIVHEQSCLRIKTILSDIIENPLTGVCLRRRLRYDQPFS